LLKRGSRPPRGVVSRDLDRALVTGECLDEPPCHPRQIRALECELLTMLDRRKEAQDSPEMRRREVGMGATENLFVWVHLPHVGKWRRGMVVRRAGTSGARLGLRVSWDSDDPRPTHVFSPYSARMCWEDIKVVRRVTAAEISKRLDSIVQRKRAALVSSDVVLQHGAP